MGSPYKLLAGGRIIGVMNPPRLLIFPLIGVMSPPRLLIFPLIGVLVAFASAQGENAPVFQPEPRPMPAFVQMADGLQLECFFADLEQGAAGLLRLSGADIVEARADFRDTAVPFFHIAGDAWYALIAANMDSGPGAYPLIVAARRASDEVSFARELRIESAGFITQALELPPGRAYLEDAKIELAELERLQDLASESAAAPLWDASGFELPHESPLTSPFGAIRRLNDGRQSRHTGWDQNLPTGTPVRAMAAGIARFAGALDIRGKYLLIDHGLGVFSGYAHFSELHLRAGQAVAAGQIIGLSGNTGRSSAPHLHWEILLRGEWVDGAAFLELWLPAPGVSEADAKAL